MRKRSTICEISIGIESFTGAGETGGGDGEGILFGGADDAGIKHCSKCWSPELFESEGESGELDELEEWEELEELEEREGEYSARENSAEGCIICSVWLEESDDSDDSEEPEKFGDSEKLL